MLRASVYVCAGYKVCNQAYEYLVDAAGVVSWGAMPVHRSLHALLIWRLSSDYIIDASCIHAHAACHVHSCFCVQFSGRRRRHSKQTTSTTRGTPTTSKIGLSVPRGSGGEN